MLPKLTPIVLLLVNVHVYKQQSPGFDNEVSAIVTDVPLPDAAPQLLPVPPVPPVVVSEQLIDTPPQVIASDETLVKLTDKVVLSAA